MTFSMLNTIQTKYLKFNAHTISHSNLKLSYIINKHMKKILFASLFTLALSTICATQVHAQVDYASVTEKIHYTYPNAQTQNTKGEWVPIVAPLIKGSQTPTLKMYIYSDLAERFAQQFFMQTFPQLLDKYGSSIQFIYVHDPAGSTEELGIRTEMIGQCAGEQQQFWTNVDSIIAHSSTLQDVNNTTYLQGVDQAKLKQCLDEPIIHGVVATANQDALIAGVQAIPTFIIQKASDPQGYAIKLSGAQNISLFDQAIAEEQGVDSAKQQITQLQQQVASQSQELAASAQQVSLLQTEINALQGFINNLLKLLHLR
ncbi:hypothetical protein C5B42_02195 [Candidatus Cerribacteria bacterium 'Amazon FNV 2010 28 9']|uniref:Thioredoxin-like fold domain-containing protein n=1 Tax=Candidatus Cerribacteria bacterium 'Amazon FNV 2010 28 9' TaxID=2081795 RepID=A0A317JUC9_9BACT|nr:MAG: hypothetical protein C5B42_02195 [Candidatus Cerribacteria bacterium 'Amazon FNV 2010 28 9']